MSVIRVRGGRQERITAPHRTGAVENLVDVMRGSRQTPLKAIVAFADTAGSHEKKEYAR